jgi:Fe-S-cluster formation regulator IscX/YfhJ
MRYNLRVEGRWLLDDVRKGFGALVAWDVVVQAKNVAHAFVIFTDLEFIIGEFENYSDDLTRLEDVRLEHIVKCSSDNQEVHDIATPVLASHVHFDR